MQANVQPESPRQYQTQEFTRNSTQTNLHIEHNVAEPTEPISKDRLKAKPTCQANIKPWEETDPQLKRK